MLFLALALLAAEPLTLERAVELAVERNETARIAESRADVADARLARARSFFFPDVAATGNYIRRREETVRNVGGEDIVIQDRNALNATAVASLTLFEARALPAWRAAAAERRAAHFERDEAKRRLAFEAAEAFLLTLGAQQVREAAERRVANARSALDEARARFEAKLVGSNDVTKAELDLATAQREAARARSDAETARAELGYLLGERVESLAPPETLLRRASDAAPADAHRLAAEAQEKRPDIQALDARARAARIASREPLLRALPSVTGSATWRYTNEAGFSGRETDWWFGVTASWSIFDGGERYAEARERRALSRIAALEASAARRGLLVDAERALLALDAAKTAYGTAQVATEAARRNAHETSELWRQGLATALDVSTARLQVFEAEVAEARARFDLALAYLEIPATRGLGPFEESR